MKLYVGNLSSEVTAEELEVLFGAIGAVSGVSLQYHRRTGDFLRYALVDMVDPVTAKIACETLDGHLVHARPLKVMEAFTPPDTPDLPSS